MTTVKATLATLALLLLLLPLFTQLISGIITVEKPLSKIVEEMSEREMVYVPPQVRETDDYQYYEQQLSYLEELARFLVGLVENPYTLSLMLGLGVLYLAFERWVS